MTAGPPAGRPIVVAATDDVPLALARVLPIAGGRGSIARGRGSIARGRAAGARVRASWYFFRPMMRKDRGLRLAVALVVLLSGLWAVGPAGAAWTTYRGDPGRSGIDSSSSGSVPFSQAWTSSDVGADVYAQPLVAGGLVIVATEGDVVYALSESTGQVVWHTSVGTPVPSGQLPCGDIAPTVGITSTPVIDPSTGRVFVSADTWDGSHAGTIAHKLFGLSLTDGSVAPGFPAAIDPSGADATALLQRTALALTGGNVIVGFGGNDGDCGTYHGWLVAVPETGGSVRSTFEVEPQSGARGGAIWGAGDGPAVDSAGDLWVETGNGFFSGSGSNYGYQESVLKLDSNLGLLDHWAPANWQYLDDHDVDLGSGDPLALPGGLWFAIGKQGVGYLLSGSHLGGAGASPAYSSQVCSASFGGAVYFNGTIYVACMDGLHALALNATAQTFSPVSGWQVPSAAIGPPIVTGGLVWASGWSSQQLFGMNPQTGQVVVDERNLTLMHFATPSASDGKLFVASGHTVSAYNVANPAGSSPGTPPPPSSGSGPSSTGSPPTCGCRGKQCQIRLVLKMPRRGRVVSAAVYLSGKRIKRRHGRQLKVMWFPSPPRRVSFTVRLVEKTSTHHRLIVFVHYRSCRRVVVRRN